MPKPHQGISGVFPVDCCHTAILHSVGGLQGSNNVVLDLVIFCSKSRVLSSGRGLHEASILMYNSFGYNRCNSAHHRKNYSDCDKLCVPVSSTELNHHLTEDINNYYIIYCTVPLSQALAIAYCMLHLHLKWCLDKINHNNEPLTTSPVAA